jgi:tRNA G18 (ribose-2'-O)-methylase SpoU
MTLVLGSEAHGVSDSILERASALVSIPMGLHVESLNVAVAAGLVMYRMQTIENDH